ncbi:DUF4199 domain-containing protein [Rhodohalobacter mucosus]|uniref:DUF4199 domain-containing protein n=1 Tax=Rhodohalobacter mucosus TaxID=2079485 RepID=A0A316TSK8_9BACT|nr:DUF4199 domain-containing protein [Rhodohalobacter mucosus]PWN07400.1 DUF4199 domain-containing protein [Rhodohalobacter mucosus]
MKNRKTEVKWALIFIAASLGWMFIERLTGLHSTHIDKHMIYTNVFAVIAIAVYVFALLDKRKNDYSGVMTYKEGFISGLIITLIVALLSPVTQYLISAFIAPDYFPNIIEYTVSEGLMSREEAEGYFNLRSYIRQGVIGALVLGVITSAVVAFFTKGGTPKSETE